MQSFPLFTIFATLVLSCLVYGADSTSSVSTKKQHEGAHFFSKLVKMYTFQEYNEEDVLNSLHDSLRVHNFVHIFDKYKKQYATFDFTELHGRRLAYHLATFMLSDTSPEELPKACKDFVERVRRASIYISERQYIAMIEALFNDINENTVLRNELSEVIIEYMSAVAAEKGANMDEFEMVARPMKAAHKASPHLASKPFYYAPYTRRLLMDAAFIDKLFKVAGMTKSGMGMLMADLDKMATNNHLPYMINGNESTCPKSFAEFCEMAKGAQFEVDWSRMSHLVLDTLKRQIESVTAFAASQVTTEVHCMSSVWLNMERTMQWARESDSYGTRRVSVIYSDSEGRLGETSVRPVTAFGNF